MEQPGCEQDQPPSRVLCPVGVGCAPLAAELQQRIGAGGSRGGSRRRRCVFLAECNALSKWFCYFAVAPVLTHRCSSVTPAPSPVFAKKRRIPSHPGLVGEGPCREQSAPSPAPRGAGSRAVSRGQAPGHAAAGRWSSSPEACFSAACSFPRNLDPERGTQGVRRPCGLCRPAPSSPGMLPPPAPSSVPAGVTVEMPGPGGAELWLEAAWFGRRPRRRSCRLALGARLRWGACAAFEGRGQFVFAAGSLGFWWACHHGNPRC